MHSGGRSAALVGDALSTTRKQRRQMVDGMLA
jgi:hypothetical protein